MMKKYYIGALLFVVALIGIRTFVGASSSSKYDKLIKGTTKKILEGSQKQQRLNADREGEKTELQRLQVILMDPAFRNINTKSTTQKVEDTQENINELTKKIQREQRKIAQLKRTRGRLLTKKAEETPKGKREEEETQETIEKLGPGY